MTTPFANQTLPGRSHLMARTTAAVALVALPVLGAMPGAQAAGDPAKAGGGTTYRCMVQGDPQPDLVPVSIRFADAPTSVSPGDVVGLRGTLDVAYADLTATLSSVLLSSKAGPGPTNLPLAVASGGEAAAIVPIVESPGQQPIKQPFVVSAPFTIPDFPVPDEASGALTISLPSANTIDNPLGTTPAKVAFTTAIAQDSLIQPARTVACWLPEGTSVSPVLSVPITRTGAPTADAPKPTTGTDSAGAAAPAPAAGLATPSVALPAAPPEATIAPAAAPEVGVPAAETATVLRSAAIPPATTRSGTFIASWQLLLIGSTIPVAGVGLALAQRRRLKQALAGQ